MALLVIVEIDPFYSRLPRKGVRTLELMALEKRVAVYSPHSAQELVL